MARNDQTYQRTEKPTQQRRLEARRRGQVPRSGDLAGAVVMLVAVPLLMLVGPALVTALKSMTTLMLAGSGGSLASVGGNVAYLTPVIVLAGVFLAGLLVAAVLGNIIQIGFLFTSEPVKFDLNRVSPWAGLGRIFSRRSAVRTGFAIVKLSVMTAVLAWIIDGSQDRLLDIAVQGPEAMLGMMAGPVIRLAVLLAVVALALGTIDYLYQRWEHEQSLKMTRQEVLDELSRESGGQVSTSRRQKARKHLEVKAVQSDG